MNIFAFRKLDIKVEILLNSPLVFIGRSKSTKQTSRPPSRLFIGWNFLFIFDSDSLSQTTTQTHKEQFVRIVISYLTNMVGEFFGFLPHPWYYILNDHLNTTPNWNYLVIFSMRYLVKLASSGAAKGEMAT